VTCPNGKIRYRNRAQARRAVRCLSRGPRDTLHPYPCTVCHGWHVGHRKVSPESMAALHGAKLRSGRI
jgi:hypothetical protein